MNTNTFNPFLAGSYYQIRLDGMYDVMMSYPYQGRREFDLVAAGFDAGYKRALLEVAKADPQ